MGDSIEIKSLMNQVIDKIINEVSCKKSEILNTKLHQKGFAHLIDEGLNGKPKRFNRLLCEVQGDEERYYVDNFTDEGVFIVGFRTIFNGVESNGGGKFTYNTDFIIIE